MKQIVKQEYEPSKVASAYWWGTWGWQVVLGVLCNYGGAFVLASMLGEFLLTTIGTIIYLLVLSILNIVATILAVKFSAKKVKNTMIVRAMAAQEIMKKYTRNTLIFLVLRIIYGIKDIVADVSAITIWALILYIILAVVEIFFARVNLNRIVE